MDNKSRVVLLILALVFSFTQAFGGENFWGEHSVGITSSLPPKNSEEKVLYLTLDACGSPKGSSMDTALINFLKENNIPATLFINSRWIDKNPQEFIQLAKSPLFKIENHGVKHLPASIDGKSIYGLKGTASKKELIEEIVPNAQKIEKLTGQKPKWYRSGTAYYDSEAIEIIKNELDLQIAGFAITLDAGATLPARKVYRRTMQAKSGDILLAHMNHPESGTAKGLEMALPKLLKKGYVFKLLP